MKILVTGAAGFIGFHAMRMFLSQGYTVVGLDNLNDYYDVGLKYARLAVCGIDERQIRENQTVPSHIHPNLCFQKSDITDLKTLDALFRNERFDRVLHMAAQVGVRYSLENPQAYIQANLIGFANVLECCRQHGVDHLVYASSSSIYGMNSKIPFSEDDRVDQPVSLYAATKRSNELMAHTYSHLYGLKTTGLRFFTVYGPWGRPDMAMFLFVDAVLKGKPIQVFNHGNLYRDFTYIDDVVDGIKRVVAADPDQGGPTYAIYNIGNNQPVRLLDFIESIEKHTGRTAIKEYLPMQAGDVEKTWANVDRLDAAFGSPIRTPVDAGVKKFIDWYMRFYNAK